MTKAPDPEEARNEDVRAEGLAALRVPVHIVEHEPTAKSTRRKIIEAAISLGVIVALFAFAIPAITGSGYTEIFDAIRQLTLVEFTELTLFWILIMFVYSGVLTSSLPGLTHPQALVLNFAGSAVSNVVPFGGAAGVATTYTMTMSWGLPVPAVTLSILVTGIWNVLTKMAIPVVALTILAVAGRRTAGLVVPTLIGLFVLVGGIVVLTLVLRSEALAVRIGQLVQGFGDRVMRILRRPPAAGWDQAILDFRHNSIGLIRTRWRSLTTWVLLYNLGQYVLLLMCVRMLGATNDQLGWIEVLAAFAFANILTTVAITPSGVGFVEAGTVAALIAFGGNDVGSAAAVFLFRGFTYLLEIPVGLVGWAVWGTRHSWRKPATSPAEAFAPSVQPADGGARRSAGASSSRDPR